MDLPWGETVSIQPNNPQPDNEQVFTLFVEVTDNFYPLRETLSKYDSVVLPPENYYHITIKRIGTYDEAKELKNNLSETIKSVPKFSVNPKGVDVFPNCIYVPIEQNDELKALHRRICSIDGLEPNGYEGDNYIPHITIGRFSNSNVPPELFEELETFRGKEWSQTTINNIHLVKDSTTETQNRFINFDSVTKFGLSNSIKL